MLAPFSLKPVVHLYPNNEIRYKLVRLGKEKHKTKLSVPKEKLIRKDNIAVSIENCINPDKAISNRIKIGYGVLAKGRKFTRYARQSIARIGGALEKKFGLNRCLFITLTLPGSTFDAIKTIAAYSSEIMNRILTWLGDNYKHSNGERYAVGCVELQKRGALHWHFVVALEDERLIGEFTKRIQQFWFRVLKQISEKTEIDLFKRAKGDTWEGRFNKIKDRACKVEKIRKSVAGYLAKYMGKTKSKYVNKDKKIAFTPASWWARTDDAMAIMQSMIMSWELPVINDKQFKDEVNPFLEETFSAYEMWHCKHLNPYSGVQVGMISRGSEKQCREWVDDVIPVLMSMYPDNERIRSEFFGNIRRGNRELIESRESIAIAIPMYNSGYSPIEWNDRRKEYWKMIKQGFPVYSALEYISRKNGDNWVFEYDVDLECLVEKSVKRYSKEFESMRKNWLNI